MTSLHKAFVTGFALVVLAGCPPSSDESDWRPWIDADGDGAAGEDDCDDEDPSRAFTLQEECADGIDNDCDEQIDEGEVDADDCYAGEEREPTLDNDGDGYEASVDCDDLDTAVNPDASEECDGIDSDCDGWDGAVDGEPTSRCDLPDQTYGPWWYGLDEDIDGYPSAEGQLCLCNTVGDRLVSDGGYILADTATDCNDGEAHTYPGAPEVCSSLEEDRDCDGIVAGAEVAESDAELSGCTLDYVADSDGDGLGDRDGASLCVCPNDGAPAGVADNADDCDDSAAGIGSCETYVVDADRDGYAADPSIAEDTSDTGAASMGGETVCLCPDEVDASTVGLLLLSDVSGWDCDDASVDVNPSATEVCEPGDEDDQIDNNCDDGTDDNEEGLTDCTTHYRDSDEDGYGGTKTLCYCYATGSYVATGGDCNETYRTINPGATEVCNEVDDDCDDVIDEGVENTYYRDSDGDSYGEPTVTKDACDQPTGYVSNNRDCDDSSGSDYPGAPESCDDTDNDCDGVIDDDPETGGTTYYVDNDLDGYGLSTDSVYECDSPGEKYSTTGRDCDDDDANAFPENPETCDGIDNDCDSDTDEDLTPYSWYDDGDGDGYGDYEDEDPLVSCYAASPYDDPADWLYALNNLDCDDTVSGTTLTTWYEDPDEDGYWGCSSVTSECAPESEDDEVDSSYLDDYEKSCTSVKTTEACEAPTGYVDEAMFGDCSPSKGSGGSKSPGVAEICYVYGDQDCDGVNSFSDTDCTAGGEDRSACYTSSSSARSGSTP